MIVGLAGLAALSYGLADVAGGAGSRAVGTRRALVWVQVTGAVLALAALPFGPLALSGRSVAAASAAGVCGLAGTALLFRLLARRPVGVASPVSAVTAAALPVTWAALAGEHLTAAAWWGVGVGLVAVALVSWIPGAAGRAAIPTVLLALGAGAGYGGYFLLMSAAQGPASGFAPLAVARLTALAVVVVAARRHSESFPPGNASAVLLAAGCTDALGDVCFVLAARAHHLALASSVTALYPVIAALAATRVLHERLRWRSGLGLGLSGVALLLLAG